MKCSGCGREVQSLHTQDIGADKMATKDAKWYCDDCVVDAYPSDITPEFFEAYEKIYKKKHDKDPKNIVAPEGPEVP